MVKEKTWVSVKSQGGPENHGTEGNRWSLLSGQVVESFTLIKISIFSLSLFFNHFNHFFFFLFLKILLEYS